MMYSVAEACAQMELEISGSTGQMWMQTYKCVKVNWPAYRMIADQRNGLPLVPAKFFQNAYAKSLDSALMNDYLQEVLRTAHSHLPAYCHDTKTFHAYQVAALSLTMPPKRLHDTDQRKNVFVPLPKPLHQTFTFGYSGAPYLLLMKYILRTYVSKLLTKASGLGPKWNSAKKMQARTRSCTLKTVRTKTHTHA